MVGHYGQFPNSCLIAKSLFQRSKNYSQIEWIFFTFIEFPDFLGICHYTICKSLGEGLPLQKIGGERVFMKDDLIKWIKDH